MRLSYETNLNYVFISKFKMGVQEKEKSLHAEEFFMELNCVVLHKFFDFSLQNKFFFTVTLRLVILGASLVAQTVKNLPATWKAQV